MMSVPAVTALLLYIAGCAHGFHQDTDWSSAKSIYDFHATNLSGVDVPMEKYRGHVVIIYDGATYACPVSAKNYKKLEVLQERYGESDGLRVVAFVVDGLAKSTGTSADSLEYVHSHNVTYDVYAKIHNDGDLAHPLYKWMKSQLPNQEKITVASKLLIDKNGQVVAKFFATAPFDELEEAMKKLF